MSCMSEWSRRIQRLSVAGVGLWPHTLPAVFDPYFAMVFAALVLAA